MQTLVTPAAGSRVRQDARRYPQEMRVPTVGEPEERVPLQGPRGQNDSSPATRQKESPEVQQWLD
jgi:hypothetical protein